MKLIFKKSTVWLLCVLLTVCAFALVASAEAYTATTSEELATLLASATAGDTITVSEIATLSETVTLPAGVTLIGTTSSDLAAGGYLKSAVSNGVVAYTDAGTTRTYTALANTAVLVKGSDIYLFGNAATICTVDGADLGTNLKFAVNVDGSVYTFYYLSGTAPQIWGGCKDVCNEKHDTSITLNSGTIAGIYGGDKLKNAQTGTVNVTVNGGSVAAVSAGFYYVSNVEKFHFTMTGGTVTTLYGGGQTNTVESSASDTHVGEFVAEISGGTITTIYGGAYAVNKMKNTTDSVKIYISGGTVTTIMGGGFSQWNENLVTVDSVEIVISGGTVDRVYAGGQNGTDTSYNTTATSVVGTASVTVTNGTVGAVYGGGFNRQWVYSYDVADDNSVIQYNYNKTITYDPIVHYSEVGAVTLNIQGGDVDSAFLCGSSWAHVGKATANISSDVDLVATLGNYGYVENATFNIASGATVGELDLIRCGIVDGVAVHNEGTIETLYAGATEGCYMGNMGTSKVAILGDVVIENSGTVGAALLTYGLEFAESVTSDVPLTVTAVNPRGTYEGDVPEAGVFAAREDSVWTTEITLADQNTSFAQSAAAGNVITYSAASGYEVVENADGTFTIVEAESSFTGFSGNMLIIPLGEVAGQRQLALLAGIDTLNYREVGFDVTFGGKSLGSFKSTVVYKQVTDGAGKVWTPKDSQLNGANCNYLFVQTMGISTKDTLESFGEGAAVTVTPYAVAMNGVKMTVHSYDIPITYFFN